MTTALHLQTEPLPSLASQGPAREGASAGTKALRIGISTSVIQRGKTGVAQYVLALVRSLCTQAGNHHITLFVLEEDLPLFAFAAGQLNIVVVAESWRPAVRNVAWHQTVLPALARAHRLDVLHVPSYRRMLWQRPCALVATIHDLAPFHVIGKYDPLRMFYGRVVARALAHRQHQIIAVSTHTAQDIETFFKVPVARQRVILNGLDHQRFYPAKPAASNAERWQPIAPFFLYVSRIEHPGKNHLRLIEAFNQFKAATGSPWQLALAGGDWHGASIVHEAALNSPFANDISFLGFVPDADLPDLYRMASAMIYPSLFEGFGMPPVEAMACGCPVISSTAGSLAEVIGDAALTIDATAPLTIADALTQVATDNILRERLIQAGLRNAQRFNWDQNARQVLQIYAHAAHTHPRI